ncbi:hypothetical protein EW145_g1002 [Phellinidium pouzarii]|uniref:Uncharacterized protein n=1 Tax=Phellinidium pouzarii TaxID=167371 RepID=A0A4S4LG80_9AGAM|nr:hypothetical protein EW145_g1002 [Phellinidium pouzarii]
MKPPGHPYTREELCGLKRADIQRICKDYGVKANMKTEALIELLLDSIHSNMSPLVRPPQPHHVPTPSRRVSTRSSSRASTMLSRGASGSSATTSHVSSDNHGQRYSGAIVGTASRVSKSRDSQYRLGVGRPLAPGGPGPRSVTRSSSTAKPKRGKNSRSLRPPEETIDEGSLSFLVVDPSQAKLTPGPPGTPSKSRKSQWADLSAQGDDIVTRLGRLESIIRDSEIKHQFDTLRDLPSQVIWLKNSLQQREDEIVNLRTELNMYRMELIGLRGDVSKVYVLQDQLRTIKENLEQLIGSAMPSAIARGKMTRRVSIPLSESDTNSLSPGKAPSVPTAQTMSQGSKSPLPTSKSPPLDKHMTTLGKRGRDADSSNMAGVVEAREGNEMTEADLARRVLRPDKKRSKTGSERRPLQEKEIVPPRDFDKHSSDHESSEESAASAGTSSGPSTVPSVGTPPPMAHSQKNYGESLDTTPNVHADDGIFNFSFRQAASSTPRDNLFNFLDEEEHFSPGSAMKAGARGLRLLDDATAGSSIQPSQFDSRRVSAVVARPRTPTRTSGPERFRVTLDHVGPTRDFASPFDPYDVDTFGLLPFGADTGNVGNFIRNEVQGSGQNSMSTQIPLALGFGLGTAAAGVLQNDTPAHPTSRTMYGTELHNDTRFGDFGRDEVASTSNMNIWGLY